MVGLNISEERNGSICIDVRVIPRSSKNEIVGVYDGALKVKLRAAPVEGAANAELLKLIADEMDLGRASVELVSGRAGKKKRIRLRGIGRSQLEDILKAKS
jgi:uncharacterized protein (TIGR00251 family)